MTFYEQELRKIVGERYPDATYVGRACYVRLSDMNRAKIQFVAGIVANQYNALQLTILNRGEGQVDALRLRFSDLLGTKMTSNPNFRNGVEPHIWDDYGKVSWYVYHPTRQDYEILSDAVSDYLEVFQDNQWCKQIIGLCLSAFLQATILVAGLMVFKDHALLGLGLMLSAGEIPRIAGAFGLDTSTKANLMSAVYTAQAAVNTTRTVVQAVAR